MCYLNYQTQIHIFQVGSSNSHTKTVYWQLSNSNAQDTHLRWSNMYTQLSNFDAPKHAYWLPTHCANIFFIHNFPNLVTIPHGTWDSIRHKPEFQKEIALILVGSHKVVVVNEW